MTVTYSDEIATAKGLTLVKLIFCKWRGSLLRLVWKDLLLFLSTYYLIQAIYLFLLSHEYQKHFQALVALAKTYQDIIPLSFVLGFFVSTVTVRWWNQFESIPWPTPIAVYVSSTLHGYDEVGRAMRRTILRYVNLSLVMVFRVLSPRVKKRFPRMEDLITAGFINESEFSILQELDKKYPGYNKNWLPICWAANMATRARDDGRIKDDFALKTIIEELNKFRSECGTLMNYATVCLPLVYVQVVAIAVYTYFLTMLIAKQPLIKPDDTRVHSNMYLDGMPFLITLQFVFYMGWLKVAETMINPFGDDDDDFEVNAMIDRNLIMSYLIVDDMHNEHPELLKDQYWDEIPSSLPDRGRLHSKEFETNKITDFFDVQGNNEQKVNNQVTREDDDDDQLPIASGSHSKIELKPRSSIIDESYRKVSNLALTPSTLDRQKQRFRERALSRQLSESSSEISGTNLIKITNINV